MVAPLDTRTYHRPYPSTEPACPAVSAAQLVGLCIQHRDRTLGHLRLSYPRVSQERLEEAVQDAYVEALRFPERLSAAFLKGGAAELLRLFKVIAWRRLRGELRRAGAVRELPLDGQPMARLAVPSEQESQVHLLLQIERALEIGAQRSGAGDVKAIAVALLDRLRSGDSDTIVATRHGVRREYLNRAKNQFREALTAD